MYLTDGQSTSVDRRCVYTFNVPENDCAQTPGPSVDDQVLKSFVMALQTQFRLMVKEVRAMGEHIDKLKSDNEKLVNVSDTLASDNSQLASDVKALQEHNDKQDIELRNLKKDRPTSDAGRTNVLRYVESHNTVLNKCIFDIKTISLPKIKIRYSSYFWFNRIPYHNSTSACNWAKYHDYSKESLSKHHIGIYLISSVTLE